MNRKRFIYFTDLILIPLFILSLYTGIKLHIAGHHANHEIWHNWTVFHTIASLLFTIFGIVHIKSHWGWYKGLKTTGCKGKKKVVLLFSITFALVIITGILLLLLSKNQPRCNTTLPASIHPARIVIPLIITIKII